MAVLACVHVRIHVPCEWMLLQTLSSHCQAAEPPEPPGRWYPPNPLLCRWRRWRCRRVRAWIGMRRRASSSSRELDLDASASGPGLNPFKDLIKVLYVAIAGLITPRRYFGTQAPLKNVARIKRIYHRAVQRLRLRLSSTPFFFCPLVRLTCGMASV